MLSADGIKTANERSLAISDHHPFRSPETKLEYLHFYDHLAEQWPIPSETRLVDTSFGQTFIRIQGPVGGAPLMLLPGDTETSLSWLPVIEPFSRGFRTYAIDHVYDNGRSIYTREMSRTKDFVDWLDKVFDELCLERLNLAGYSYGGWQSTLYALAHPNRIEKLVLLARRCFKRRKLVPPTLLTDANWRELRVPTLFLIGENDRTYSPQRAARRLHRVAPEVEAKVAPNTDHYILLVNPDWVVRNTLRFLQELAKS